MNQSIPSGDIAPRNTGSRDRAGSAKRASSKSPDAAIRVTSPVSLLTLVPSLLGFQPGNSMVIIGIEPPRARVRLTLRYDLPDPPREHFGPEIVEHALAVLGAQGITTAVAVGYGPGSLVTPVADAIRAATARTGLRVTELLRAEGDRYWSYLCSDPVCCPPEGTVFDAASHAASLAPPGDWPPVLASRAELAATVAAAEGEQAELMQAATCRAEERAARLVARVARSGRTRSGRRLIASAGLEAVAQTVRRYRRGDQLGAGSAVAWLTVALRDVRVRDDAWARMDPRYCQDHVRLWTDVTRLARPGYAAAPASLLAFVAWQSGNGALANVALDRALTDNPRYSMAQLLRQVIDSGAPPSMARLPMSPEEVAASYAGLDDDAGQEPGDAPECPEVSAITAEEPPPSHAGPHDG
ncbi:MAG TPA: DUF4192 domain-containing protein [Trebonia sp.]|jgi:hypothetical protein|nr:DUF4192 domain-containing protein [Trebonia sp.]